MKIEVGKKYVCSNGKTAIVERDKRDVYDFEMVYPFSGHVYNDDGSVDRLAYWTSHGRYNVAKETIYDITDENNQIQR